jgi:hypothetical protein
LIFIDSIITNNSNNSSMASSLHRLLLVACSALVLSASSTRAFVTTSSTTINKATTNKATAFVHRRRTHYCQQQQQHKQTCLFLSSPGKDDADDDSKSDQEGADLAAMFFKMAQEKGIGQESLELEDDEEDEDEEDDEEEVNLPQGAINAFLGYDTGDVGEKLAGNVTLTDDQLYSEVKERVLDTAGGFVDFVQGAKGDDTDDDDEDEDDNEEDGELLESAKAPKPYEPPTTVPDSELTAGEVVLLVLNALLHNDVPSKNKGVEILFGYSSPGSSVKNEEGLTPAEYAEFLKETEYKVLFSHQGVSIDKGDYSFDGKKGFFLARVCVGPSPLDTVSVNFILSTTGVDDDACWLVDSMLIRPQSMRRRRRR